MSFSDYEIDKEKLEKKPCRCCGKKTHGFDDNILVENYQVCDYSYSGRQVLHVVNHGTDLIRDITFWNRDKPPKDYEPKRNVIAEDKMDHYELTFVYLNMFVEWYTYRFMAANSKGLSKNYPVLCGNCQTRVIITWLKDENNREFVREMYHIESFVMWTKDGITDMANDLIYDRPEKLEDLQELLDEYKELDRRTDMMMKHEDLKTRNEILLEVEIAFVKVIAQGIKTGLCTNENIGFGKGAFAKEFGIPPTRLNKYLEMGLPHHKEGSKYKIYVNKAFEWMCKNDLAYDV